MMKSSIVFTQVLIQRHASEDSYRPKKGKGEKERGADEQFNARIFFLNSLGFKSDRSLRLSQLSAKDSNVEEYWFFCQQWLDASKGDRQTFRELLPTDENGNPLSDHQEIVYRVHVFTGDKRNAGTDANVFLTIYGENFDSGERELMKSNNMNKFERNQVNIVHQTDDDNIEISFFQEDIFDVKAIDLGRLRKIKIRHDNKGVSRSLI